MRLSTWASSSKLLINSLIAGVVMLSTLLMSLPVSAATSYYNGFEVNTEDWSSATRKMAPLSPSSGSYYADVPNGAFTRWNGYESTFPVGGYTTNVDVYIDMSLATGGADKRFDFSSAINDQSGNHRRDFVFNIGTNPTQDNQWLASVSNNTPGNPSGSVNPIVALNNTGWYTLSSNFQDNGSGVLKVTMTVTNKNTGVLIGSWNLSYPSDLISTVVGGHRYGWFVNHQAAPNAISTLSIDNARLSLNSALPACANTVSSFDNFTNGSVNGQEGWSATGPYDQAVVDNVYGYTSFGCKSLRMSNATTSGSFGDQVFSYSVLNEAGETSADNGSLSGGTRQNHFEASWDFASETGTYQPDLAVSISPDRGDGARMSWVQVKDTPTGLAVVFNDYDHATAAFRQYTVASDLDRTSVHNAKVVMDFVDGASNDVVKVYVNGELVRIGTSWEDYFRDQAGTPTRTVDSLLFHVRNTTASAPASTNHGFLFDNVLIGTSTPAPVNPGTGGGQTGGNGGSTPTVTVSSTQTAGGSGGGQGAGGDGTSEDEGEVLGADANILSTSTDDSNNDKEVKGVTDEDKKVQESSNFLGLGWWWIPLIVAAILLFLAWLRRRNQDTTA